ncbi:hypothetical protein CCYA_CCYA06G1844 [Cyanidiococcus yangmingshanensis]|nr:hypothetical protein CCYA_CCYA06G1844 [Cyanidiococcus yangmingshanensis]
MNRFYPVFVIFLLLSLLSCLTGTGAVPLIEIEPESLLRLATPAPSLPPLPPAVLAAVEAAEHSHGNITGPHINETIAAALNYTQFQYTLANSLLSIDPHICLNEALTMGAGDVAAMLTECTIAQVNSDNCSYASKSVIEPMFRSVGWDSSDFVGIALARKFPAAFFNWSGPAGEGGDGLRGIRAFAAGLELSDNITRGLGPALRSGSYKLAAAGAVELLNDEVYAYVVVGRAPGQTCYKL